jgi:hypothetical protein
MVSDFERYGRGLFEVLSLNFYGGTEENHANLRIVDILAGIGIELLTFTMNWKGSGSSDRRVTQAVSCQFIWRH